MPTLISRADRRCGRCGARADGEQCADCTSPWVYMRFWEDHKWRCRLCALNIAKRLGYEESAEEVQARILAFREEAAAAQAAREEANRKQLADAKAARIRKRTKAEQDENLFTLEDNRKKKRK